MMHKTINFIIIITFLFLAMEFIIKGIKLIPNIE